MPYEQEAQREGDEHADQGVAVGELRHCARGQQDDGGPPGAPLAPFDAVGEQEQQDARTERERRGERAEGAREHLGEGVHAAVPEAREDPRGNVDEADRGAGASHQCRYGRGSRPAQEPARMCRIRDHS